jgi:predicted nuclease of predicted toxin-antitoxin system
VKLLLDENLSVRLVQALIDIYPDLTHVDLQGLHGMSDSAIWDYARQHGYVIVTKDADFAERSALDSDPPKIVWIRLGNCARQDVERLLRFAYLIVHRFVEEGSETCLMLGRASN